MDRARVRRILGELVDTHGRLVSLTDDEFLRILRQITRLNPRSAMISQRTSQLPDEVEGGTGIAMPESELKRPPDSRENA